MRTTPATGLGQLASAAGSASVALAVLALAARQQVCGGGLQVGGGEEGALVDWAVVDSGNLISVRMVGAAPGTITRIEPGKTVTLSVTGQGYTGTTPDAPVRTINLGFVSSLEYADDAVVMLRCLDGFVHQGETVTASATAGAFTDGTLTSAVATAAAAVNSSTLPYSAPMLRIAWVLDGASRKYDRDSIASSSVAVSAVGFDLYAGLRAAGPLAAVRFTATAGELEVSATATVSTQSSVALSVAQGLAGGTPDSGRLWMHSATLDLSSLPAGPITITATAYPQVGSALRSDSLTIYKGVSTRDIYVHNTAGSDANPGTLAQPLATVARAMDLLNPVFGGSIGANEQVTIWLWGGTGSHYTYPAAPIGGSVQNGPAIIVRPHSGTKANTTLRGSTAVGSSNARVNSIRFQDLTLDVGDGTTTGATAFGGGHPTLNPGSRCTVQDCAVTHVGGHTLTEYVTSAWLSNWGGPCTVADSTITDIPRLGLQGNPDGSGPTRCINSTITRCAIDGARQPLLLLAVDFAQLAPLAAAAHLDSIQWDTDGDYNSVIYCVRSLDSDDQGVFSDKAVSSIAVVNWLHCQDFGIGAPQNVASQFGRSSPATGVSNVLVFQSTLANTRLFFNQNGTHRNCRVANTIAADLGIGDWSTAPELAGVLAGVGHATIAAGSAFADDRHGWTTGDPRFVNGAYGTSNYNGSAIDYHATAATPTSSARPVLGSISGDAVPSPARLGAAQV